MTDPPDVDYAVPADVPRRSRRERTPRRIGPLWDGPTRTALKIGCWAGAALLSVPLALPVLLPDETGAETPEAAVARLLQGIADVDAVAIVAAVDPVETGQPDRADVAYDRLSNRVVRIGDEVPVEVTAVLEAAEAQVGGGADAAGLATLAAVDLALVDLELRAEAAGAAEPVRVFLLDGRLEVDLDPGRLPDDARGLQRATYEMPLTQGWVADADPFEPYLTTVERDGRWYVSLEETAADLLGGGP